MHFHITQWQSNWCYQTVKLLAIVKYVRFYERLFTGVLSYLFLVATTNTVYNELESYCVAIDGTLWIYA